MKEKKLKGLNRDNNIPKKQRALVLQGGGALGAYEAGVFKALYEGIFEKEEGKGASLFDVVSGTSVGAINATILVSHVKHHKTWKDSEKHLKNFWIHLSSNPRLTDLWLDSWYAWRRLDPKAPSKETARRYYATREFTYYGVPRVFSGPQRVFDKKFLDPTFNTWYRYDNQPLKDSIKKYAKFPISTDYEKKEPRLILTSVDVQEGKTVTFDSYRRSSRYGDPPIEVRYEEGIEPEHVIASASVPVHYDYAKLTATQSGRGKVSRESDLRFFWDGGIMSNTPLRELIAEHKFYWENKIGSENLDECIWKSDEDVIKVPDLEVYIVNLWPTKENKVPLDYDGVVDRKNDLVYHDKTHYDEKVALLVTDYIGLAKKLIELAKQKGATKNELENILKTAGKSVFRSEHKRKYKDLLKGRFQIKVQRIERRDDPHTISKKWMDFTPQTISNLISEGYEEGLKCFKHG